MTLYYAFKQEEQEEEGDDDDSRAITRATGWETFLEAVTSSGFQVTATWPVRASQKWRLVATGRKCPCVVHRDCLPSAAGAGFAEHPPGVYA